MNSLVAKVDTIVVSVIIFLSVAVSSESFLSLVSSAHASVRATK